jgi:glutamine cyclotransferase
MTAVLVALFAQPAFAEGPAEPPELTYKVVHSYPHDPRAFTQGLVYLDGALYESTGLRGQSRLRRVELETGAVLEETRLLPMFFGEGISILGDRIYQLTWTSGVGFVYDRETFRLLREFRYAGEGWGMTHNGKELIVSDGSPDLVFWDPETLVETRRITVRNQGKPVGNLNELEYIDGEIWANIWLQERIARISLQTGEVVAWIDFTGILPEKERSGREDVMNGIAWDPDGRRLFVTGKLWPKLFEVEIVPKPKEE